MEATHRSGADLKDARERAGLTQEQVAAGLGVSRVTVVGWEQRARVVAPKADRYLRVLRDLASSTQSPSNPEAA